MRHRRQCAGAGWYFETRATTVQLIDDRRQVSLPPSGGAADGLGVDGPMPRLFGLRGSNQAPIAGTLCAFGQRMAFDARVALCLAVFFVGAPASAQVLVANDDFFAIPYGSSLAVEAFGVLDNDDLGGENAGESGATAQPISDVSHGTLDLASDGSFTYAIGPGFDGNDNLVYRASAAGAAPVDATVTLTACEGGPEIFTCWKKSAFLAKAAEFGHPSFSEGFEDPRRPPRRLFLALFPWCIPA
jgi:hypothetical protein